MLKRSSDSVWEVYADPLIKGSTIESKSGPLVAAVPVRDVASGDFWWLTFRQGNRNFNVARKLKAGDKVDFSANEVR